MISLSSIHKASILIVDDCDANVLLLERMLHAAGYENLTSTVDPTEVCVLHSKNKYDLIILDLEMPHMDGFQVLAALKEAAPDDYLPVIAITAQPKHKIRALRAGAKDFVSKPFDVAEVLSRITNILEVRLLYSKVREHGTYIEGVNQDLDSFTHCVSHDLRAPLRLSNKIAHLLLLEYGATLPADAVEKIQMIMNGTMEMGALIDDLLRFSRSGRDAIKKESVDMHRLASDVWEELEEEHCGRLVDMQIDALPKCEADPALLRQVLINLLGNAIKFTRRRAHAKIHMGFDSTQPETVYFIRDNGVGFDSGQSESMFQAFHRLHHATEFEGSGVGLALVKRIIERHGGRIWTEGVADEGATFYYTLGGQSSISPSAVERN